MDVNSITRWQADQRGYIAIVTLMLIPVFLLLAALVIDTGYLLAQKSEIQGIADALALSSATGVYRKVVEVEQIGPNKPAEHWDWFVNPKRAGQEANHFLGYIMGDREEDGLSNHRSKVTVEEISIDATEKQVRVVVKAQARSGLLQWRGKRYIYATASAGLNTGGGAKPVPRVDALP